jgi:L-iditol 2-dehydrogenase
MDVLRLYGAGDVRFETRDEPVPGPGEELVRMTAVGLCGSDLHWYEEGAIGEDRVVQPLLLGHEMGGVIAAGPSEGERVIVEPANACGRCDVCLAGHSNLCQQVRFCGHYPVDGGMATYLAWPRRLLIPAPDTIVGDDVALVEPLGIALHAIVLGRVRPGMSVGVYGCGPIGQFLIRALRAKGAGQILATDPLPHRREAAVASGADDVRDVGPDGLPADVDSWGPVDVAFDASGSDAAIATALTTARPGGRVVLVGIPSSDRTSFSASTARHKGLTMVVAHRMNPTLMHTAVDLIEHGLVDLSGMISATYPLSQGAEAFRDLAERRGMKVIVKP